MHLCVLINWKYSKVWCEKSFITDIRWFPMLLQHPLKLDNILKVVPNDLGSFWEVTRISLPNDV